MFYDAHSVWLEIIIIIICGPNLKDTEWSAIKGRSTQGCHLPGFTPKSPDIEFWLQSHLVRIEKSLYFCAS